MPVTSHIRAAGNSAGITIPKPILNLLEWAIGTAVTITVKRDTLIIAKSTTEEDPTHA